MMSLFKKRGLYWTRTCQNCVWKYKKSFSTKKRKKEQIKDKVIRDIKAPIKQEDDYYKPTRAGNILESQLY